MSTVPPTAQEVQNAHQFCAFTRTNLSLVKAGAVRSQVNRFTSTYSTPPDTAYPPEWLDSPVNRRPAQEQCLRTAQALLGPLSPAKSTKQSSTPASPDHEQVQVHHDPSRRKVRLDLKEGVIESRKSSHVRRRQRIRRYIRPRTPPDHLRRPRPRRITIILQWRLGIT